MRPFKAALTDFGLGVLRSTCLGRALSGCFGRMPNAIVPGHPFFFDHGQLLCHVEAQVIVFGRTTLTHFFPGLGSNQKVLTAYKPIKELLSDEEYSAFQQHLANDMDAGALITHTGSLRKVRWAVQGTGKSGGVRGYLLPRHSRRSDSSDFDIQKGD